MDLRTDQAGLLRELQETLEYQTAKSDILRVISRSAFDLSSGLLTVVTYARAVCRAEMAVLFRCQEGAYRFAVGHGVSPAFGLSRVALQLPTQMHHTVVDRTVEGFGIAMRGGFRQPLAGERAVRTLDEQPEQIELACAQTGSDTVREV
jgi:hypothetical protein